MKKSQKLLEKIATYRDLNEEERRRLYEEIRNDPQAAKLLSEYEKMDEELSRLAMPAPRREFSAEMRQTLERERATGSKRALFPMLRRLPIAAGRVVLFVVVLVVLATIGSSFRQQLRLSGALEEGAEVTATVSALQTADLALPPMVPTPTPAVEVDPQNPFQPFLDYLSTWPQEAGMARGALRAGMTSYLQQAGGIASLDGVAEFDSLLERVRPYVQHASQSDWENDAVQLLDLNGDGHRELIVALLPHVELFYEDGSGVLRVQELTRPAYGVVESSRPLAVEVADLTGDGIAEVGVIYSSVVSSQVTRQFVLVQWNSESGLWESQFTVPLPYVGTTVAELRIDPSAQPPLIETVCQAYGVFQGPQANQMLQRNLFQWDGDSFEWRLAQRTEATTVVQHVNVAEAYLREGQFDEALARYQQIYEGALPGEGGVEVVDEVGWRAVAALRTGQLLAIMGRHDEVLAALSVAAEHGSTIGYLAQRFAATYEETGSALNAWLAMASDPESYARAGQGAGELERSPANVTALIYPEMAVALAMNEVESGVVNNPDAVQAHLEQYGVTVGAVSTADYDGDSVREVLVAYAVGDEQAFVSLLDWSDDGWFGLQLAAAGNMEDVMARVVGDDQSAVPFPVVEMRLLVWDGRHAYQLPQNGYGKLSYSSDPSYLCPLWAESTVEPSLNVGAWNDLLLPGAPPPIVPGGTPTPVRGESNPEAPPAMITPRPTAWDGEPPLNNMTPTPTAWDVDSPLNSMTPTLPPGQ